MAAIARRSIAHPISQFFILVAADDLDGVTTDTACDVTGTERVLLYLNNSGTAGTAGIDIVEISHDDGKTWAADTTVILVSGNDNTGTVLAAGALMAAGVEPTTTKTSLWKAGPYEGPTWLRIGRKTTTTTGTTWVTGAPEVGCVLIGGAHGGGAPTAVANNVA
jgi:hypothetical protein